MHYPGYAPQQYNTGGFASGVALQDGDQEVPMSPPAAPLTPSDIPAPAGPPGVNSNLNDAFGGSYQGKGNEWVKTRA